MKNKSPDINSDVVFFEWQETLTGDYFALYRVLKNGHPSYGSTVSEKTIKRLKLKTPEQHYSKYYEDLSGISGNEGKSSD